MQNEIGLAIRLTLVAVGESQRQLAAKISIRSSALRMIENGKRMPTGDLAQLVPAELGADAPRTPRMSVVLGEARRIAGPVSGMAEARLGVCPNAHAGADWHDLQNVSLGEPFREHRNLAIS